MPQGLFPKTLADSGKIDPINTVKRGQRVQHVLDRVEVVQREWRVANDAQIKVRTRLCNALGTGAKQDNLAADEAVRIRAKNINKHRPDLLVSSAVSLRAPVRQAVDSRYRVTTGLKLVRICSHARQDNG
jgi:hypothetical protein